MKNNPVTYLERSLRLLEKWLPDTVENMLENYLSADEDSADYSIESDRYGYVYCVFAWQETDCERAVLLVYDDEMRIIADASAVHCSISALLSSKALYDELCDESDWMFLGHYTLCGWLFPDVPYPPEGDQKDYGYTGDALLYSNAYVTKAYRRKGIFTAMSEIMRDFALRRASGSARLCTVFSLDPDIAVYGPDACSEPYHYSFEKDEPERMRNKMILEKLGFDVIRLEETEADEGADGTKLWFAVREENDLIVEAQQEQTA